MAEAGKGGWSRRAATSSARVRPAQAASGTCSASTGRSTLASTRAQRILDRRSGSWRLVVLRSGRRSSRAGGCPRSACRGRRPSPCRRSSGRRPRRRSAPPSRRRSGPTPSPRRVTRTPGQRSRRGCNRPSPWRCRSGWQSGISSWVRFAAMMPASRAVPSTSPFLASPWRISASVSRLHARRSPRRSRCGS